MSLLLALQDSVQQRQNYKLATIALAFFAEGQEHYCVPVQASTSQSYTAATQPQGNRTQATRVYWQEEQEERACVQTPGRRVSVQAASSKHVLTHTVRTWVEESEFIGAIPVQDALVRQAVQPPSYQPVSRALTKLVLFEESEPEYLQAQQPRRAQTTIQASPQRALSAPSALIFAQWDSSEWIAYSQPTRRAGTQSTFTPYVRLLPSDISRVQYEASWEGVYVDTAALIYALRPHDAITPPVVDAPSQRPAGRAKHRKRRYIVEIDNQEFEVSGIEEAQELLDKAKNLAASVVTSARNSTIVKPGLKVPQIRTPNKELVPVVQQARKEIRDLYSDLQRDLEIRFLLARADEEDEEEAIIRLLM